MSEGECLFCSIVSGKEPAKVLLDLEDFLVIENKYPRAPVHILILDKQHNDKFGTISGDKVDDKYWGRAFKAIAQSLRVVGLEDNGEYEIVINGPSYAHFQHQHIHILGKYESGAGART